MKLAFGKAIGLSLLLVSFAGALAETTGVSSTPAADVREEKKFGGYLSIGNPYPSILGLNAAYNINKDFRASLGYGEVEVTTSMTITNAGIVSETVTAKTYGAGIEYLFFNWPVRGIVGVKGGYFDVSGEGEFSINGFDKSTGYMYSNLGFDWISRGGFHLGGGMNVAYLGASGSGAYLNAGWFF